MKVSELRIGNYFYGHSGKIFKWELQQFVLLAQKIELDEIMEKPVYLTEGFLLKLGARKHETGYIVSLDTNTSIILEPTIYEDEGDGYDAFLMQTDGHTIQVNILIKYVHQLQNLFFSLTGEELEIKIPT